MGFVMKHVLLLLLACATLAHAGPQSDDIVYARRPDGVILSLSMQECPFAGFYWWHAETSRGLPLATGCWTVATHHRIMITDGRGGASYLPISTFINNPTYDN